MHALLIGTGGAHGWPEDGCRCASCMRARQEGLHRRPGRVLIDGTLDFSPTQQLMAGTRQPVLTDHRITRLPGGFELTGPDGSRLLLASGPGDVPEPPSGSAPYDIALLDLLASPVQLGRLRAQGLVREYTEVVALYADHRVSSEQELARRCTLWQASPGQDGQLVTSPGPGVPAIIPAPATSVTRPHRTLVVGGARSGKSTEAELRLAGEPQVTYLAAGPWPTAADASGPDGQPDPEWAERVRRHQQRRPSFWHTTETLDLAGALTREPGALLIDGIGTWLAAVMAGSGMWAAGEGGASGDGAGEAVAPAEAAAVVEAKVDELVTAWRHTRALVVAVTDQVGSGLVPPYPAGRVFRDQLGWLNQRLAAESELSLLVVAGRVTTLPS